MIDRPEIKEGYPPYIEVVNAVDNLGYEIWPVKVDDGYTVVVFFNDQFLRRGKHTYKNWQEAMRETYYQFYKHFKG